ncbi:MAG: AAA family ATPase [Oscillatoria sp. SIO1A7]|nr:AAA family ATPase [Oscillatoria sp. SIO1A7]
MLNLPGYKITQTLSSGVKTTIYRGIREADQKLAIVKVLTEEYPPLEEIARLRQEYIITQKVKSENIVKSYSLEIHQNSYALILEDVKGKSLKELLEEGELRLREILRIAISLAETLGDLHQIPVLHKDIKSSNIIVNDDTGQVKITDFGIASQLTRETPRISNPKLLEGTLAYMSPEQTGRMNRAIDYRTDYYALGATLYEMLTGQVPFVTNDPMELVHCHLAKKPIPPSDLNLDIPEAVSDITMKLMAKTAEDRYQSPAGLKYDLEKCLNQLQTNGTIENFPLGERDRGSQLLIPEKLYGREQEVAAILDAFDRVSGMGGSGLGGSGLGGSGLGGSGLVTDVADKGSGLGGSRLGGSGLSGSGLGGSGLVTDVADGGSGLGGSGLVTDVADKGSGLVTDVADKGGGEGKSINGSRAEMLLVFGYSGIGKTAIVNEVHKPIVRARGYFIAGKFDQFRRDIPYAALIQAFTKLVRQILTESSEQIAVWKARLLEALGSNGQAIVDVIPELELIVGKQPELPKLGPTESQNRFNRLFQQFIGVFTQKQHPLVLFLDDLQWADSASLKLLELLMGDPERQYLLLIGAYRDNEVSATHPLVSTLERIQESGAAIGNINVGPLQDYHVRELLADTLGEEDRPETVPIRSARRSRSKGSPVKLLADLLFQKTQGNPFFLTQLLKTLYEENLLLYDAGSNSWKWDIEEIQAVGIADYGIVELIGRNLQKLPAETQNLLKLAACIGNQFNLEVLAVAAEKSQTIAAAYLWEALQAGTILPLSDNYKVPLVLGDTETERSELRDVHVDYKFLHDRVQQAAYSLIPEAEKKETHLRIGQLLLEETTPEERKENIFALVNQLNYGTDLLEEAWEKEELAELNLTAGQKAKGSAAYEASLNYLEVGLGLLAADSWQSNYELSRELYVEGLEAAYLNGNFDRATALTTIAEQETTNLLDKVRVNELKLRMYMAQNKMQEAIDIGLSVLELLDVSLVDKPPKNLVVEDCYGLPEMTDTYKVAATQILTSLINPAYVANPELLSSIIFTTIYVSIINGNSPYSAYTGYCMYGVVLCDSLVNIEEGYRYGQLALRLLEKFNIPSIKCRTLYDFEGFIKHWKEHIRETTEPLENVRIMSLEGGDIEMASYSSVTYCTQLFFTGEHLATVGDKLDRSADFLNKTGDQYAMIFTLMWQQLTQGLLGESEDKLKLSGTAFHEAEMLPVFRETNNATALFWLAGAKIILLYLFKDGAGAALEAREAEQYAQACPGMIILPEHNFYYSLALLAQHQNVDEKEQKESLEQVAANQEKMKIWASHAPMNFQHKYDLVEAEKARVLGDEVAAIDNYDRAIAGARKERFTQEEAIANELAGEFHLGLGRESIGKFYIIEAYYTYVRWGAIAKVEDLEERYPQFLSRIKASKPEAFEVTRTATMKTTTAGSSGILDFPSILKASQAISGEIVLDKLLKTLIEIAIENAGAQLGILVLKREEQMVVEAVGMVGDRDGVEDMYGICDSENQSEYISTICAARNLDNNEVLPLSVINYVARTQKEVVLNNATVSGSAFASDLYIQKNQVKSILCAPIIDRGQFIGIIYLENNLIEGAFTSDRVKILNLLCSQAAISLQNARLYEDLKESEGREREKAVQLEQYLQELKQAQLQLVQSEKMSTLGELVAGVAHEINNPVGFIAGNIDHAEEYSQDLINVLRLYQQHYPNPVPEIEAEIEANDLEYLIEDLPQLITSMKAGTDRIRNISTSLRTFSRSDVASKVEFNVHDGLDSTLMILKHRLKASENRPEIEVVKKYDGELPNIRCYPGQLNQVFMNILANGIDALEEYNRGRDYDEIEANPNRVIISTELSADSSCAVIRIKDNGPGIPEQVQQKLFEHLFTTKPVGKGTGLGLSISRQIVEEKHGGKLSVVSALGEGAEFLIEIPL